MTAVNSRSTTIVKLPAASRMATATSAEPATTAGRNQRGRVPLATVGPPIGEIGSTGSKAAAGFSSGVLFTAGLLRVLVRPGDDQPGDHVDDEGDPEEHEARRDQRID